VVGNRDTMRSGMLALSHERGQASKPRAIPRGSRPQRTAS
jgi:hypothetical protein